MLHADSENAVKKSLIADVFVLAKLRGGSQIGCLWEWNVTRSGPVERTEIFRFKPPITLFVMFIAV